MVSNVALSALEGNITYRKYRLILIRIFFLYSNKSGSESLSKSRLSFSSDFQKNIHNRKGKNDFYGVVVKNGAGARA